MQLFVINNNAEETLHLGRSFGMAIAPGVVIAASGGLGMGKTVFAQGLAQGLGVREPVTSPTFTYIQEYRGRLPFCHVDAYRLEGWAEEDLAQLGLSDCFLRHRVAYVEWPQYIGQFLPADAVRINFSAVNGREEARLLSFQFNERIHLWLTPPVFQKNRERD